MSPSPLPRTGRYLAPHPPDATAARVTAQLPVTDDQAAVAPAGGGHGLTDSRSASPQHLPAQTDAAASCDIGAAITILMARYPITYAKAFAAMIASSERTHRSLTELAAAVINTHAQQPHPAPRWRATRTRREGPRRQRPTETSEL